MPLHPQIEALLARRSARDEPPLYRLDLADARRADLAAVLSTAGEVETVASVRELHIGDPAFPARLFRPVPGSSPLPTLIYLFGGGWSLGSLDTCDHICRHLANTVPCQVLAVGYRRAPEHPFPSAVLDCHWAAIWASRSPLVDASRVCIGGDSAGGNLAAAVTLLAREKGPDLAGQLLVYPNTVHGADTGSMREANDPRLFNRHSVQWYWDHYLRRPDQGRDPLASPLLASDHRRLPPALVITAEFDPLRDEGEQYAEVLRRSGVPTIATRYAGMPHGFFSMFATIDGGRDAMIQTVFWLRMVLQLATS